MVKDDRSSRPHSCPNRTPPQLEAQVVELRATRKLGPARIGMILDMPTSTVNRGTGPVLGCPRAARVHLQAWRMNVE